MEILSPAIHVPLMQPPSTAVTLIKNTAQDKHLTEEINNTLRLLERGDLPFYHKLVHSLYRSHDITKYYIILAHCPLLIKPDHRELLDAIFSFDWQKHDETALLAYTNFLVHLNAAGTTHLVRTFESLIRNFNLVDRPNNRYSAIQITRAYTHETLKKLLWIIPSSPTILWPILMDMFPHRALASEIQRSYTANLLHLVEYCPVLKDRVISNIIDKLIQIDVEIKLEDLLAEEENEDTEIFDVEIEHRQSEVEEMAEKMDQIMLVVIPYIEKQITDPTTQEEMLAILLRAFDAIIVRTHRSKFTQFLIYLACKLEASFAHQFLNYLCHKLCYDNGPIYIRQTCAAYLGSFIGRAAFLSIVTVKEIITLLVTWGNKYLDLYGTEMPDAEKHALFYSVCQSLFYLFCFKGRLLLEAGAKSFLKQLPIHRIIHSNLNPLKMCLPIVVREFSRLSKTFPQWDCASVMTKNKTLILPTQTQFGGANKLDSFFPFDPYLLRSSSKYFNDGYQVWTGPEDDDEEYETEDEGSGHYHNGYTHNETPSGYVSGFSSPQRSSFLSRSPSRAIINSGKSSRNSSLNNSPLDIDMASDDSYSTGSPFRIQRSGLSISPSFRGSGSFERAQFLVEDMIEDE